MATAIHTADDLIRILRQDPEILEQVRRAILTDELLELPGKFAEMAETQARMLETQSELLISHRRLEDRVGYLIGAELERKAFRILPVRLNRIYQLRRPRIVLRQGDYTPHTQGFLDDVENALDSATITEQQYERILLTDLVIRASRKEGDQGVIYFAVEASGTIARRDIDRAVATSEAIHDLYQTEAIPVAVGYRIHRADQTYANSVSVRTIILEEEEL